MRYIDILIDGITQNVKASDLRFKTYISDTINIPMGSKNLLGANNLTSALSIIDAMDASVGEAIDSTTVDNVIKNINNKTLLYEGDVSTSHIFIHNLETEFFKYDIWVLEDIGWQNSIVPITIIDENTVRVDISLPRSCRIILTDIKDINKTYGL